MVKDSRPNVDETGRRVMMLAKRTGGPALTGDPVADGATLNVAVSGVLPTEQTFNLPGGQLGRARERRLPLHRRGRRQRPHQDWSS